MEIKLDDNLLREKITEFAAQRIVEDYFSCSDLTNVSYQQREVQAAKRLKDQIDKVDWDKAPEKLNRLVVQEFFKNLIEKMK